jgi:hypothetical protein
VEISEEVILDSPEEIDAENFIMPFYGKVTGCVNWGNMWWGSLKKVIIQAAGQTVERGFECGTAGWTDCDWTLQGVPQDVQVDVTVYGSCVNGVLIEAQTQIIPTGTNKYDIQYLKTNGYWSRATNLEFVPTTPPECGNTTTCSTISNIPDINLIQHANGFEGIDICLDPSLMSGFVPIPYGMNYIQPYQINVCFNLQTQKWEFSFDNLNTINFNIIIDICPNNIINQNAILIDDYQNFPPEYGCANIIEGIKKHYDYPMHNSGSYVLQSILLAHENQHKLHFQGVLEEIKDDSFIELLEDKNCGDFINESEALIYYQNKARDIILNYWKDANKIDEDRTGLTAFNQFPPNPIPMIGREKFIQRKIYSLIDQKYLSAVLFYDCWSYIFPKEMK